MRRLLVVLFALLVAMPAFAGKLAVVDFERAVNETEEGKAAQERLDTMYATRKAEIERLRDELQKELEDYQARSMILSEDARAETEKRLAEKQSTFEQTYMRYQTEMQQTYYTLLSDLDEKMRKLTTTIASEQGYDLVIDKAAVVYAGGETVDMTDLLIKRYNETAAP
jgi:outer membrane protein